MSILHYYYKIFQNSNKTIIRKIVLNYIKIIIIKNNKIGLTIDAFIIL